MKRLRKRTQRGGWDWFNRTFRRRKHPKPNDCKWWSLTQRCRFQKRIAKQLDESDDMLPFNDVVDEDTLCDALRDRERGVTLELFNKVKFLTGEKCKLIRYSPPARKLAEQLQDILKHTQDDDNALFRHVTDDDTFCEVLRSGRIPKKQLEKLTELGMRCKGVMSKEKYDEVFNEKIRPRFHDELHLIHKFLKILNKNDIQQVANISEYLKSDNESNFMRVLIKPMLSEKFTGLTGIMDEFTYDMPELNFILRDIKRLKQIKFKSDDELDQVAKWILNSIKRTLGEIETSEPKEGNSKSSHVEWLSDQFSIKLESMKPARHTRDGSE